MVSEKTAAIASPMIVFMFVPPAAAQPTILAVSLPNRSQWANGQNPHWTRKKVQAKESSLEGGGSRDRAVLLNLGQPLERLDFV